MRGYTTAIIIVGIILIIVFILLLKVRLYIGYADKKFYIYLKVLSKKIKLEKNKKEKDEKEESKRQFTKEDIDLLFDVFSVLKRINKSIIMELFYVDICVKTSDAAQTALLFGTVNAAVWPIYQLVENNFKIKEKHIKIEPLFSDGNSNYEIRGIFYLKLGSILYIAIKMLLKWRKNKPLLSKFKKEV